MAKPKKSAGRGGAVKQHGPKRKLFHCYNKTIRLHLAKLGLLNKYNNYESFVLACQSRGFVAADKFVWAEFQTKTLKEQREWFKSLKK